MVTFRIKKNGTLRDDISQTSIPFHNNCYGSRIGCERVQQNDDNNIKK